MIVDDSERKAAVARLTKVRETAARAKQAKSDCLSSISQAYLPGVIEAPNEYSRPRAAVFIGVTGTPGLNEASNASS